MSDPSSLTEMAVELGRGAVWITLVISAPVLVTGMIVGLVVGLLQAVTQIQEQTIAFVPKIAIMILVIGYTLPWLIGQMVQYSTDLIAGIPGRF